MILKTRSLKALILGLVVTLPLAFSHSVLAVNVIIETSLGDIEILLRDDVAPQTVANFLNYVNDGDYDNTFIHRNIAGFIIQGGGFTFVDGVPLEVPSDPPVINEPGLSNVRGTNVVALQQSFKVRFSQRKGFLQ